jgi:uncharacterized protein involved in cysteine biosynthesis
MPALFARSLYLVAGAPIGFVISLVPFIGPPLAGIWFAEVLSFQQTAFALQRRGLGVTARRKWHGEWQAESLGFGVAGLVLLPLAAPILAPALAIGATLLVLEIEGDPPPAEATPVPPPPAAPLPPPASGEISFG